MYFYIYFTHCYFIAVYYNKGYFLLIDYTHETQGNT